MSVAKVLRLDEYRDRRTHRLRLAEALHRVEPLRHAVFTHLVEIADLTGADRVATVWVDEYGSGLIHPHVVLDQLCDRPRRQFAPEPLHEAWELGVPAALDRLSRSGTSVPTTLSVALGSDGTRAWFVVADSVFARPMLEKDVRDRVMFLAGECASVVLHRDLDAVARRGAAGHASSFAGWPILEDLEGREDDDVVSARIARRFVVGRLVRMLVDDDLAVAPERMADQVRRARAELLGGDAPTDERDQDEVVRCERVLDALETGTHDTLAAELVELGDVVEAQGHTHGALELYRCANAIAVGVGAARPAVDAARLAGRLLRRQADWEGARRWFTSSLDVAETAGMADIAVRALVGLGGITRELGNLPGARETFRKALAVAETSDDREVVGLAHHALLGLEHQAGDLERALQHGWLALVSYKDEVSRTRCMAGLGGALMAHGDLAAAEDAWTLVLNTSRDKYYLVYAHDALGHLAALQGDETRFEEHSSRCDALGWESALPSAQAEILLYRGLSYRALGREELAREWLRRALRFAEQHQYHRVLFRADEALKLAVRKDVAPASPPPRPAAPREVREGLRAMRQELAGVGA